MGRLPVLFSVALMLLGFSGISAQRRTKHKPITRSKPTEKYVFISPDRDFTLTFPIQPVREPDEQGSVTIVRSYAANTKNGLRFSINFQDVGGDPRSAENNQWNSHQEEIATEAARNRGETVIQIHRIAKNIIDMEITQNVPATGGTQNLWDRSILRRGRIYTLGCGSLNDLRVDPLVCRRFFNSIRFTK